MSTPYLLLGGLRAESRFPRAFVEGAEELHRNAFVLVTGVLAFALAAHQLLNLQLIILLLQETARFYSAGGCLRSRAVFNKDGDLGDRRVHALVFKQIHLVARADRRLIFGCRLTGFGVGVFLFQWVSRQGACGLGSRIRLRAGRGGLQHLLVEVFVNLILFRLWPRAELRSVSASVIIPLVVGLGRIHFRR